MTNCSQISNYITNIYRHTSLYGTSKTVNWGGSTSKFIHKAIDFILLMVGQFL